MQTNCSAAHQTHSGDPLPSGRDRSGRARCTYMVEKDTVPCGRVTRQPVSDTGGSRPSVASLSVQRHPLSAPSIFRSHVLSPFHLHCTDRTSDIHDSKGASAPEMGKEIPDIRRIPGRGSAAKPRRPADCGRRGCFRIQGWKDAAGNGQAAVREKPDVCPGRGGPGLPDGKTCDTQEDLATRISSRGTCSRAPRAKRLSTDGRLTPRCHL